MMGTWWKRCDRRTDRRKDGQTEGLNQSYSCLVAAKNVNLIISHKDANMVSDKMCWSWWVNETQYIFQEVYFSFLWFLSLLGEFKSKMNFHLSYDQDINQSIKSSFVNGAGAHPQNAPCLRCSNALRSAPIRRGRILSTVLHRWSPRHSYPECRPQINHTLSNLASRTHPKSSPAVQDTPSQGMAWTSPYLSHHWNTWHAQTT